MANHWMIFFHDQDRPPEIFTDEAAAIRRYTDCKLAWTCDLFVQVEQLAEARRDEREQCAKVCETIGADWNQYGDQQKWHASTYLAAQIRGNEREGK